MKNKTLKLSKRYPIWRCPKAEKTMKTLKDYGITDYTPKDDPKWKKVKWIDFRIVVPDEFTKKQLLAAFEFIHNNNSVMDNDYMAVNAIAHSYLTPEREKGCPNRIIVDSNLFRQTKVKTCSHTETYLYHDGNSEVCKECGFTVKILHDNT